jgi:hypothetical protein
VKIPYKFSAKDLISLVYVNPWVGLAVSILISPFKTKLSIEVIAIAIFSFVFSCFAVFYNNNFDSFINWLLIITLLIFNFNHLNCFNTKIPSMLIADIYIFIGTIIMLYVVYNSGSNITSRYGLYGGEPNFTGFVFLSYLLIYLQRGFSKAFGIYLFILFISILVSTVSRTFLLSSVLLGFFYFFRNKNFLITFTFILFASAVFFGSNIMSFIEQMQIFESSGYSEDLSRLLSISDSSSQLRLELQDIWYAEVITSYKNIFYGMPLSEYNFLNDSELIVHNSFIQKTAEYGIVYIIFFIILSFKYLPLWITYSFFTYALFLHAILSIPWVIAISLLATAPKKIRFQNLKKTNFIKV